ncbi:MAG: DUF2970 domain-containing protein [Pseudomonadota bacterium]|nr:MAG: DUF2970 domain-containing protein [Pseudomonadota bacterium]
MSGDEKKAPGIWQVISSVLASLFGVQSNRARARDFEHGKPSTYIIVGLIGVVLFILLLVLVVNIVLSIAGV